MWRKPFALVCALCLCFSFTLQVNAKPNPPADSSLQWLLQQTPQPTTGDEDFVLLLLRGGYANTEDPIIQQYLQTLRSHCANAQNLQNQTIYTTSRQILVLLAAGVELEYLPTSLLETVSDTNSLLAEGFESLCSALLVFGHAKATMPKSSSFTAQPLAQILADMQNIDGGFGEPVSNAYFTALALQSLSAFEEFETACLSAEIWLQQNSNEYGGFNAPTGAEDAAATAEVMLALSCLGVPPAFVAYNAPSMAEYLLTFQGLDDGFIPAGEYAASYELTVLCTAALAAGERYENGQTGYYDFNDVVPVEIVEILNYEEKNTVSNIVISAIIIGIIAVITLVVVLVNRKLHRP